MIESFLKQLSTSGIELYLQDGKLMFNALKGSLTDQRKAQIKENKTAIVQWFSENEAQAEAIFAAARALIASDSLPLSYAQQRLWFIDEYEGGTASYNLPNAFELKGTLNKSAFSRAINTIIERHEVLRTHFIDVDGTARQVIAKTFELPVVETDISHLSPEQQKDKIAELALEDVQKPFDLSADVLLRLRLIKLSNEHHHVLFNMHHIASDGWSMGILTREFSTLYSAFCKGEENPLAPLKVQYADYAIWQRDWLESDVLDAELDYWSKQLADVPGVHSLPLDNHRPLHQTFEGKRLMSSLNAEQVKQLKALCQSQDVTMFMLLQTAFSLLLSRYSDSEDIVMGTPVAGRLHQDTEALIGFFVNSLVLRTNVSSALSFSDLLAQNKETIMQGYAHQNVPFEMLVDHLKPERSLSHTPIFQVMFALQNFEQGELSLEGLELLTQDPSQMTDTMANFEIILNAIETKDGMDVSWQYNSIIFSEATIERLARSFNLLLDGIIENAEQNVAKINLFAEDDFQFIQQQSSNIAPSNPDNLCIHQLFEHYAKENGQNNALIFGDETMSYGTLNSKANRLAHHLIELGIKPETTVGFCFERSFETVISMLAIVKAGGAYVPLDPQYPSKRLAHIISDSGCKIVLANSNTQSAFPYESVDVLCLDEASLIEQIAKQADSNPDIREIGLTANNLINVIYTSGSTGLPKGVMVEHGGIIRLVKNTNYVDLDNHTVAMQLLSISFDAANHEIWGTLGNGGTVVLYQGDIIDIEEFNRQVVQNKVNTIFMTTALFDSWSHQVPAEHDVRQLLFGGEIVNPLAVQRAYDAIDDIRISNIYGPTENTTFSTCHLIARDFDVNRPVPIGQFITGTYGYVLQSNGDLAPRGAVGELFVGGDGIARGYLNLPDLTEQSFIADPFSDNPDARIYGTGDLVRWNEEGALMFVGRADEQVKIRGFRIELEEIDACLSLNSDVETAVSVVKGAGEDKAIVAYVVTALKEDDHKTLNQALQAHLHESLPQYMHPSVIVFIDELPINANGKVDKAALPEPDYQAWQQFVEPAGDTELKMAEIWQDILKIERISATAGFFELGGHSLLATRVVSAVSEAFEKRIAVRNLFEHSTISALSAFVDQQQVIEHHQIPKADRNGDLPLSYAQQRLWFISELDNNSSHYNIPGSLVLSGELNIRAFEQSIKTIIERHEVLRTNFNSVDGKPTLVINDTFTLPLTTVDLSGLGEEEQAKQCQQLVKDDATAPFDLSTDVLLRASLIKCSGERHLVLFNMHHIASDGWSMSVLTNEFSKLYEAYSKGQSNPLPPLNIQYADFALWQRNHLEGELLDNELNYWREQLADVPVVHSLPLDNHRPAEQTFAGKQFTLNVDSNRTEQLKTLCQSQDVTLFMLLQSAFSVLLSRYSNNEDIVMGSPVAGRLHQDTEALIGFFVNTLVMRSDVSSNLSFSEFLAQNKQMILAGTEHQNMPFEMLVDQLQPERSLAHTPIFQILFALQNVEQQALSLQGLELAANKSSVDGDTVANFELVLNVSEGDNGLDVSWLYNTAIFNEASIKRLADSFDLLLDSVVADVEQNVAKINLLAEADKQFLRAHGGDIESSNSDGLCVHQLFEQCAEQNPDTAALVLGENTLSYGELNARSNQLAHHLIGLGVRPDTLVGFCFERSFDMFIAMLAIAKAGGAYVPLDPQYPSARLAHIINDSRVEIIVANTDTKALLPLENQLVLCLDQSELTEQLETLATTNPDSAAMGLTANHLVNVLYTSGSTGLPKGVMVEHFGLKRLIDNPDLTHNDRVLQLLSVSFDGSHVETWGTIGQGGTLVLYHGDAVDIEQLNQQISGLEVNSIVMTPALFENWSHHIPADNQLKNILIGGDVINPLAIKRAHQAIDGVQICNVYGPTENTTVSTHYLIPTDLAEHRPIAIGQFIPGSYGYVLQSNGDMAPRGAVGELYLGGDGIARGYLNLPEMTESRFIADPFSENPDARLYRTGDLVRWNEEDQLVFVGRVDEQVKIRGFRIELGEIDACLNRCSELDAVINVVKGQGENKTIVAYAVTKVPAQEHAELLERLRTHMQQHLPQYMHPATIMFIDEMPLTTNGKVNKAALPEPDYQATAEFVAPSSETEVRIEQIWQGVLKLDRISIHCGFFELGGHSLLATRVVSAISEVFEKTISVRALFEHNTIATLSAYIDQQQTTGHDVIPQADRNDTLPLSYAQQRLWFIDQLDKNSSHYNMPGNLIIHGQLNIAAFEQAIKTIIDRHEVLRTNIKSVEGKPVQVIRESFELPVSVIDLSQLDKDVQKLECEQLAEQDALAPFDLSEDVLFRCTLIKCSDEQHLMLFNVHHIASDGWSMGIIVKEFNTLYEAFSQGKASPLGALKIQYADFAKWQHGWLSSDVLQPQISYWKDQLKDLPNVHGLELDHPRGLKHSYSGATYRQHIPTDLVKQIKQMCLDHNATLFMFMHCAVSTLVGRYSDSTDIVLGSSIAGREHRDTEDLIGFFLNTLVLRSDLSQDPTFEELLVQNKQMILDGYANQHVPFEMLVDELKPERNLAYNPLFQLLLAVKNYDAGDIDLQGVDIESTREEKRMTKFDLEFDVVESEGQIEMLYHFNVDLFKRSTIAKMADNFEVLLSHITRAPETRLSQLSLLSDAQSEELLVQYNDSARDYPKDICLHQFFEQQVEQNPDAEAVIFQDQSLTFTELNYQANRVAHYLIEQGVKPDSLVGICVERSVDMIVGLLAIMKAGGAYVPLDSSYPKSRLAYMLEDSSVSVILTQQQLINCLPENDCDRIILNDSDMTAKLATYPLTNPQVEGLTDQHLAYAIYTSGSTGQPKGVLINHSSVVNFLCFGQEAFLAPHIEGSIVSSPIAFDATVQSLFVPLFAGKYVELLPEDALPIESLADYLFDDEDALLFKITPAHLKALAAQDSQRSNPDARHTLVVAGEQLTGEVLMPWMTHHLPNATFINEYGPTEATVGTCTLPISPDYQGPAAGRGVPIGKPLGNAQCYVLDSNQQLLPAGCIGELYIGGAGLAREYHNLPEMTAEKFIKHPFSDDADARLYRTGDLVKWLEDGTIEYIGRIDNQVKLRGFRIELGEIESVLSAADEVDDAAVIVRQDNGTEKRLVAYLVVNNAFEDEDDFLKEARETNTIDALKDECQRLLPDYMTPGTFVFLDEMPLTPNGKLDRKGLPAPQEANVQNQSYVAPRNEIESKLCEIWREVLKLTQVGIEDNFFAIGGDSIVSIQVVSRAKQDNLQMTVRQLLEYPTIASLAPLVTVEDENSSNQEAVTGQLPLLPVQHHFFARRLPVPNYHNQSIILETPEGFNMFALEQMLTAIIHRHDAFRLRFNVMGQQVVAEHLEYGDDMVYQGIEHHDISSASQDERDDKVLNICMAASAGLDISHGPIFKACFIDYGNNQGRLYLCFHHLVMDGVSWRILLTDIELGWSQLQQGQEISLMPKSSSLQKWGQALSDYAEQPQVARERDYWLKQLAIPVTPLPTAGQEGGQTQRAHARITEEQTSSLLGQCNDAYRTKINELLIAALMLAWHRWTDGNTLRLDMESHGREELFEDIDISDTIGWFTAVYPFIMSVENAGSVPMVIKQVRAQYREIPSNGMGFGLLKQIKRDSAMLSLESKQPSPGIKFNYMGQFDSLNQEVQFKPSTQLKGPTDSPENPSQTNLLVTGDVQKGVLDFTIILDSQFGDAQIFAELYEQALVDVIEQCENVINKGKDDKAQKAVADPTQLKAKGITI